MHHISHCAIETFSLLDTALETLIYCLEVNILLRKFVKLTIDVLILGL